VIKNSSPASSSISPQRRTEKRKKALSLLWKISLSSGSIYKHKNFYGGRKKVHQIDDEARLSWGTTVKTKQLSPTSLAFMQLVPGDNRAVRHICIRCIIEIQLLIALQYTVSADTLISIGWMYYFVVNSSFPFDTFLANFSAFFVYHTCGSVRWCDGYYLTSRSVGVSAEERNLQEYWTQPHVLKEKLLSLLQYLLWPYSRMCARDRPKVGRL